MYPCVLAHVRNLSGRTDAIRDLPIAIHARSIFLVTTYDSSAGMPLADDLHNSNYIGFTKIWCQQESRGTSGIGWQVVRVGGEGAEI